MVLPYLGAEDEAEIYRSMTAAGETSHYWCFLCSACQSHGSVLRHPLQLALRIQPVGQLLLGTLVGLGMPSLCCVANTVLFLRQRQSSQGT